MPGYQPSPCGVLVFIACRLKNQQSKLFQQLHNFKTRQRTLLTGTPLQNNLAELWMLLHFLDAGKFQSLQDFEADFSDVSHGDQVGQALLSFSSKQTCFRHCVLLLMLLS